MNVMVANGGNLFAGQRLFLHVIIDNKSNRKIDRICIYLYQIVKYTAFDALDKTPQQIERREAVLNAVVDNSFVNPQSVYERDINVPIPSNIPGTIRYGEHIHREYELVIIAEMTPLGSISLKAPILLLEWSPLLKGEIGEVVSVNIQSSQKLMIKNPKSSESEDDSSMDVLQHD